MPSCLHQALLWVRSSLLPPSQTLGSVIGIYPTTIAYDGTVYFLGGSSGFSNIYSSTDGLNWSSLSVPGSIANQTVFYQNGTVFAFGCNGNTTYVYASTDHGITWNIRVAGIWVIDGFGHDYVVGGDGANKLVAVLTNTNKFFYSSNNGATWSTLAQTLPVAATFYTTSIAWNGSAFVMIGSTSSGGTTNTCLSSPDGITWASQTLPTTTNWTNVAASPSGTFCAIAGPFLPAAGAITTNICATSPDGATWTQHTMSSTSGWYRIIWASTQFMAFTSYPSTPYYIAHSTDGITWNQTDNLYPVDVSAACAGAGGAAVITGYTPQKTEVIVYV